MSDVQGTGSRQPFTVERRSGIDRRHNGKPNLQRMLFNGRRETIRRREDRRKAVYLDRYHKSLFGIIVLILLLSVTDAILTMLLISHGAVEVNPVMAFYIGVGPYTFLFVKYTLTSFGLVILVVFRNRFLRTLRVRAGTFLYVIMAAFIGVVSWQIFLINKVIV